MAGNRASGFWRILLLLLCALVLGGTIGLYLGWSVWPIEWFDTAPSDLTLEGQLDYVVLVADSYAVTNNLEAAQVRLFELTDEDTSWAQVASLSALAAQYEASQGRVSSAERINALIEAIGWNSVTAEIYEHPSEADNQTLLLILGGAALLGFVGILLSWPRRKREHPVIAETTPQQKSKGLRRRRTQEKASPESGPPSEETLMQESAQISESQAISDALPIQESSKEEMVTEADQPSLDEPVVSLTPSDEPDKSPLAAPEAQAADADGDSSAFDEILNIMNGYSAEEDTEEPGPILQQEVAHYALGDDDYAVSFNIEGADGAFLGECGVSVAEVLSNSVPQHVVAFEVLLFNRSDVQAVTQILCSPWAMQDANMQALLEPRGELVVAQEGTTIILERLSTIVTFTVAKMAMGEEAGLPADAWFESLDIDVQIEVKQAPSV